MCRQFFKYTFIIAIGTGVLASTAVAENIADCRKGWNATQTGRHQQAVELFDKCMKEGDLSAGSLARTYRNRGIANRRMKAYDDAVADFTAAIDLKPRDIWDDYINRGNTWSNKRDFEKAMDDYSEAIRLKPDYHHAYYNRGIAYERQGKLAEAIQDFNKAYDLGLRTKALLERRQAYKMFQK